MILSESTTISLGVAITLGGAVWWASKLYATVASIDRSMRTMCDRFARELGGYDREGLYHEGRQNTSHRSIETRLKVLEESVAKANAN